MDQILDQPEISIATHKVKYAGFWIRFGAAIIDWLILAPLSLGLSYFNIISWKDPLVYLVITLVTIVYKPAMEYLYGATLGKMSLRLKVVNLKMEAANFGEILLRNVFHIIPNFITLVITVTYYQIPAFEFVTGYVEYSDLLSNSSLLNAINIAFFLLTIVDVIVLLADDRNRSLHDKIGGTYVIERMEGQ